MSAPNVVPLAAPDARAKIEYLLSLWSSGMREFDLFRWCNTTPTDKGGNQIADPAGRPWGIGQDEFDGLLKRVRAELIRWRREQRSAENQALLLFRLTSSHAELVQSGDLKAAARLAVQIGQLHALDREREQRQQEQRLAARREAEVDADDADFPGSTQQQRRAVVALSVERNTAGIRGTRQEQQVFCGQPQRQDA
ncbi:MAG: hypothetical protein ABSE73_12805 [Planctomycetota bacterium]